MPKTLLELLRSFRNRDTILEWLLGFISVIISDDKAYRRYFDQSRNKLLTSKVIINIVISKSRIVNAEPESYDFRAFVTQETLRDILKDYGLNLNGSKIEKTDIEGGNEANIVLRPFNIHFDSSRNLHKIPNAIGKDDGNERITLVGVGALGSQILNYKGGTEAILLKDIEHSDLTPRLHHKEPATMPFAGSFLSANRLRKFSVS
ncbi:MAG: hypothetical protein LBM60_01510 [Clostridium sp.]|jgi:hypothetical protein|nr:hypothetical protein [Clostridium sp.]